jgi:ribonuclease HI
LGNPGPGGWAYVLRLADGTKEIEAVGGEERTTNNRMELLAAITGLRRLSEPHRVDLYSDSQYLVHGLQSWLDAWKAKGWKRAGNAPVKNMELWQELDELRRLHELRPIWVRGHDDHAENERCDRLAVTAAERYQKGIGVDAERLVDRTT